MIGNDVTERIGVHKVALCFLEKFGWIEREQYVADHGIDTQIEIVENGAPTGLLYCVQVKAGESYIKKTKDSIVYYAEERHVNYWLNHSLPVLLVIFDPRSNAMHWSFVNNQSVSSTGKGWKVNVPYENRLGDEASINEIRGYYFSDKHFTVVESGIDTSNALSRRISMKIVLKGKIPDVVIEGQLPKLVEGLRQSDYYRSEIVENQFKDQPADCVWIWFYRSFEQYNNGLPFCTAFWNHPDSDNPTTLRSYDKEVDGICIAYSSSELPEGLINRRLSKGRYLKIVDQYVLEAKRVYETIEKHYMTCLEETDISPLKDNIGPLQSELENLIPDECYQSNPPLECTDLGQVFRQLYAALDNIFIIVFSSQRDYKNIIFCVKNSMKLCAENFEAIKYERRKVV